MDVTCLHGDKKQKDRIKAFEDFKTKRTNILIATDVASRGLDFQVDVVINFELPNNFES